MSILNKIIMTIAGLLLITGTSLKFFEMIDTCVPSWDVKAAAVVTAAQQAGEPVPPQWKANVLGFWESYEFLLIQIPLEFALGVWLVCGLFRKAAWLAGTLCYLGFIGVTVTKVITGAESCGCFGQIHVAPWITLSFIDIPFFLLLAIFRPKGYKLLPPPWPNLAWLLAVFVPTIALMAAAPGAMVALRPDCIKVEEKIDPSAALKLEIYKLKQELTGKDQEIESLRQQLLTAQQTPPEPVENGTTPQPTEIEPPAVDTKDTPPAVQQWDWLQYVAEDDVREQISQGLVVVMMHRFDCDVCGDMAPRYSEYYQQLVQQGTDEFKIAFLEIPPYGDEDHVPDDTRCIEGTLTDEKDWLLISPYVVALLDGQKVKEWPQGTAPEPENLLEEIFEHQ